MPKAIDVDGYLNYRGELCVTLRQGSRVEHSGAALTARLSRDSVVQLVADLQAALNMDDTTGDNEGAQ